jgi:hypothetical protein
MLLWGRIDILSRRFGSRASYGDYYEGLYSSSAPGWEKARGAMEELVELSRADGFGLCMFILPELHAVGTDYLFSDVHEKVEAAARNAGMTNVFDLAGSFRDEEPESLWVSMDDAHPNDKAHAILADAMYVHLTASCLD